MRRVLQLLNLNNLTLSQTKLIHALIVTATTNLQPSQHQYLSVKLLRSYAINHDCQSARQLFDQFPKRSRNIYLWNSMIRAYAIDHDFQNSLFLFSSMQRSDTKPDGHTFACIIRAFAEKVDDGGAKMSHGNMIVSGMESDYVGCSALVSAYSKLGLVDYALDVFHRVPYPDLVLWNSMISCFGYAGCWQGGLEMFHRMQLSGQRPDGYSLVGLVSCFKDADLIPVCKGVHGFCLKGGFDSGCHVRSSLVSMYSRCNCLDSAREVFERLPKPDLVTWSAMISGFSQAGRHEVALAFFNEMHALGRKPDAVLVSTLLCACASLAAVDPTREIHCYVVQLGFDLDVLVSCSLMDAYLKCGFSSSGLQIFETMPRKTLGAYNIVIFGLGSHGSARRAIGFFDDILAEGLSPDKATFSALLCACCHSLLTDEGLEIFRRMQDEFGIKPQIEHYVYMVRLLGVSGELQEAKKLIENMSLEPDSGVWGALLWGCNVHGDLELAKYVADQLHQFEPRRASYRVMLSNICAADQKWDDVHHLRDGVVEEGAKKVAGSSWVGHAEVWKESGICIS